jgi:hypothetical protein
MPWLYESQGMVWMYDGGVEPRHALAVRGEPRHALTVRGEPRHALALQIPK